MMLILLVVVFGCMALAWWVMAQWAPREGYGNRTFEDLAVEEQTGEVGEYSWDCQRSRHMQCDGCDCGCHNDRDYVFVSSSCKGGWHGLCGDEDCCCSCHE